MVTTRRGSRATADATINDHRGIVDRLQAWLCEHRPLDLAAPDAAGDQGWSLAVFYLSHTQGSERAEDRRVAAVAQALMRVLGRQVDDTHDDFRLAANAARETLLLAQAVRRWRTSAPILHLIEMSLRLPRRLAEQTFTTAATTAQTRASYWSWTAWLSAAIRNPWLSRPCLDASAMGPTVERWWRWTVWLGAAMQARRTEFVMHDLPEQIECVATVAAEFERLANHIARQLHFNDPGLTEVRRGRPTDYVRRELAEILRAGGFSQREAADLIEDPGEQATERLRGRSRRTRRPRPAGR